MVGRYSAVFRGIARRAGARIRCHYYCYSNPAPAGAADADAAPAGAADADCDGAVDACR